MSRRLPFVLAGVLVLASAVALTGGVGVGQAGPRVIDPFTLSGGPSPANHGKRAAFTISFQNASKQTLTQVEFHGQATGGATFYSASASQGTCQANSGDASKVDCTFPNQPRGGPLVTATIVYTMPAASPTAATAVTFSGNLITTERGGDPGSTSLFTPTPSSVTLPLQATSGSQASDVLRTGEDVSTLGLGPGNAQAESVKVGKALSAFVITSLLEGPTDGTVCAEDADVTPFLSTVEISTLGSFDQITVTMTWLRSALPPGVNQNNLELCHEGQVLEACPEVGAIPAGGCVSDTVWNREFAQKTAVSDSNGGWAGGY